MGIDPVQNKAHSKGRRLLTETDEVLRAAQNGVGTHIVSAVVSVVGAGLDDGVEINAAHTQPLQIRELFLNAPESAAVKIIRAVSGLKGAGQIAGRLGKAFMQLRGLAQREMIFYAPLRRCVVRKAEAVGKDLVHDAAAKPFRRVKSCL